MGQQIDKLNEILRLRLVYREKDELNEKVTKPHFLVQFDGIKWIEVEEHGSYLYKKSHDKSVPYQRTLSLGSCSEMFILLKDSVRRRVELSQMKKKLPGEA